MTEGSPPLVELRDVSVQQGELLVLQDLSLDVYAGEHLLLQGPNGGGKSSLLKLLRGELWPQSGTRRYFLDGQWRTSAVRAKRAISLVSPEVEAFYLSRDFLQTVSDVLLAAFEGDSLRLWEPGEAALTRQAEVAEQVGLRSLLTRDFRTLSHGQRRRAVLGRALMSRPQLLLLDEFTDGLSVSALAELRAVLMRVAGSGVGLVLASHVPQEAPDLPWRRLWLEQGRLSDAPPPLPARKGRAVTAPGRTAEPQLLVELKDANLYRNGNPVLHGLNWRWQAGEHWLISGPNGAGKSSFARLVAGNLHPALGGVARRPALADPISGRETLASRSKQLGLISAENAISQRRDWTGFEVIASGFSGVVGHAPELDAAQKARVNWLAERLDASELLNRKASSLSQGQLKRLLIARALVHRPSLLILDEVFDFLDARSAQAVLDVLQEAVEAGASLLMVAHRAGDVPAFISHELRLEGGRILSAEPLHQPFEKNC